MDKAKLRTTLIKINDYNQIKRSQSRLQTLQLKLSKQIVDIQDQQNFQSQCPPNQLRYQYNKKIRPARLANLQNKVDWKNQLISSKEEFKKNKQIDKISKHPYKNLVSEIADKNVFRKFINMLYKGIMYSEKFLKGPSEKYLASKMVALPESEQYKKKFLILDLDQTLIHTIQTKDKCDVILKLQDSDVICFNIRPYCYQFLEKMKQHYAIYVFTASTPAYAHPIIQYLNKKLKTIQGVLSRPHCMQTKNGNWLIKLGFFIKDLRIIKNRGLKDIVMVDNLVHSFGLQLTNGIPILQFINDPKDQQLRYLQKMLLEIKDVQDVRVHLDNKLKLRKLIQMNEKELEI